MKVVFDIEANGLENPTKIWLIVCKDIDTNEYYIFRNLYEREEVRRFEEFSRGVDTWIGHNILGYDVPVIRLLLGLDIPVGKCLDTLIVSKLVDYSRNGHSIEDYGLEFGQEKGKFTDFSAYSKAMEDYCIRDVDICHGIYRKYYKYVSNLERQRSIALEHQFQLVVNDLHTNGFAFDVKKAAALLGKVEAELAVLDKDILDAFPPREVVVREFTPRATKFGTISKTSVPRALWDNLANYEVGKTYRQTRLEDFNPSSHKQIIGVLAEAGWSPVDKTKTHIDAERERNKLKREARRNSSLDTRLKELDNKLDELKRTGWKVNEHNVSTLPEYEHYLLWKNKCRLKIGPNDLPGLESIINGTRIKREHPLANIIIKIPELIKIDNFEEIMGLIFTRLNECVKNRTDVARFVASEKNLWSIIVTPTETFVDCSASFVTDTWAGMKDLPVTQQTISQLKSARALTNRIILEARRRTLTEWLSLVREDGRIHGRFYGLGAWTHRCAHQNPNTANIPNEYDITGKKKLYGKDLRSLWVAPKNRLLVGCDAEGIQLRIFAHYIDDPEFTKEVISGDVHTLNQSILGAACRTRDAAKRFIYAMLLGAGLGKLGEILGCEQQAASAALARLVERYQGFALLKEKVIPADAKRGWFVGLDGRAVAIPGDDLGTRRHLAMSGYLQNGEAVVMKLATLKWWPLLKDMDAKIVNFVHDEWQVECPNNMEVALRIANLQADSLRKVGEELNLKCPLAGSFWNKKAKDYTIDINWSKTH